MISDLINDLMIRVDVCYDYQRVLQSSESSLLAFFNVDRSMKSKGNEIINISLIYN